MKKLNKAKIAKRLTRGARDRKGKSPLHVAKPRRFETRPRHPQAGSPPFHAGAILAAVLGGSFLRR